MKKENIKIENKNFILYKTEKNTYFLENNKYQTREFLKYEIIKIENEKFIKLWNKENLFSIYSLNLSNFINYFTKIEIVIFNKKKYIKSFYNKDFLCFKLFSINLKYFTIQNFKQIKIIKINKKKYFEVLNIYNFYQLYDLNLKNYTYNFKNKEIIKSKNTFIIKTNIKNKNEFYNKNLDFIEN